MNWEMISALIAVLTFVNGVGIWILDTRINEKISRSNDELMERINGKYLRSDLYSAKHDQLILDIARKLDRAECVHRQAASGPISNH